MILLALLVLAQTDTPPDVSRAKTTVEVFYMAPGQKVWIPPPVNAWGRGFTLDEYLVLLQMDADLKLLRDNAVQRVQLVDELQLRYTQILKEKDDQITTLSNDKAILGSRSIRLEEKWEKCQEDLVQASGGPVWPYVVAIAGATIGVVGLSVGIGMMIDANVKLGQAASR